MKKLPWAALAATVAMLFHVPVRAGEDAKPLQGIWLGQTMEANGKPAPNKAAKRMRFTFEGDTLLIRGNFSDERELKCSFKIDAKQTPHHLDFRPMKEKTVLGIYEVKGDVLKICVRHANSGKGRPSEFKTAPDSDLILIVLQKKKRE